MQFITLGAAAAAGVWSFQQMQQRQAREDQLFDGARAETPTQPPPSEADLQAGRATRWLKLQDDKKSAKLGSGAACALSGQLAVITDKISGRLMEVALTEEGWELRRGVKNNSMSFNSAKATSLPMANVFLLRPLERGGVALVSPGADGRCVELQQDKRTGMATVALSRHTKSEAGQAWYVRGDSVVSLGGKCCFQFQPVLALPGSAVAAWETEQMRRFGQVTYKLETTTARLHAAEMRMAELEEQVAGEGAANGTTAATAAAAPALPPPPQQQQAQQRDPSDGQAYVMEQLEVVFAARIWELKQQHNRQVPPASPPPPPRPALLGTAAPSLSHPPRLTTDPYPHHDSFFPPLIFHFTASLPAATSTLRS